MLRFILSTLTKQKPKSKTNTGNNKHCITFFNFSTKKYILSQFPYPSG